MEEVEEEEEGRKERFFLLFMRNVFWTIDIVLPPGRKTETQNSIYLCSEIKLQWTMKRKKGRKTF